MTYENKNFGENRGETRNESLFSKRIKAGKRRTYFFDVRATRGNDYFITITESKKRFDDNGYDRHKIFLYKEDFNKFLKALTEAVDYVKIELMPDFDFDAYNHDNAGEGEGGGGSINDGPVVRSVVAEPIDEIVDIDVPSSSSAAASAPASTPNAGSGEEVDKW